MTPQGLFYYGEDHQPHQRTAHSLRWVRCGLSPVAGAAHHVRILSHGTLGKPGLALQDVMATPLLAYTSLSACSPSVVLTEACLPRLMRAGGW